MYRSALSDEEYERQTATSKKTDTVNDMLNQAVKKVINISEEIIELNGEKAQIKF